MATVSPIIASVVGVFLVMLLGAVARHRGWLTREADTTLANLTANVMLPAFFIAQFFGSDQLHSWSGATLPPLLGFVTTGLGFLIGWLIARWMGPLIGLTNDSQRRAFAICVGICNYGYIPIPLAQEYYPDAVVDLIIHNVGVDLALWSIGIYMIGEAGLSGVRRAVCSPPFVAVLFSLIMIATGLDTKVPKSIMTAIDQVGSCAIPLGLLLSGAIIVDFLKTSRLRGGWRLLLASVVIRQAVLPLMILAMALPLASTDLRIVLMLQAAMPAAVFPIVLVKLYGRDTDTALRVVLGTSLFGILTIPIWIAIGTGVLGLDAPG